ncbi:MAG TPA: hypothetical protein VMZ53_12450 [Kofleriaceae bacterium]|nr:hypothetical protein [Kofleriaceae bacterium]
MKRTLDAKRLTETEIRCISRWVAACAARVLPVFEAAAPNDSRPRDAIEGARAFARGGKRTATLRSLALAALAAAREVRDPAAMAAARAAGYAASSAFTHPGMEKHQIKHVLGPVVYAVLAKDDREISWALRRATPALRNIVRRMQPHRVSRSRLDQLYARLDTGLRHRG